MSKVDFAYKNALKRVLHEGSFCEDRTGVGTYAVFGQEIRFDASEWFLPLLTLRSIAPRIAFEELMWMLRGDTDVKSLQDKKIHIWDGNTTREALDKYGKNHIQENTIGKGYSYQFRNFGGVDQLKEVVNGLINNPNGRRHMINLWNVGELKDMSLEPCHFCYIFNVVGGKLYLQQTQRSADSILGIPTNLVFATFFLGIMSALTKIPMGEVVNYSTNFHIYSNHIAAARTMVEISDYTLSGKLTPSWYIKKEINTFQEMLDLQWSDIGVLNYEPILKFTREELPMAV